MYQITLIKGSVDGRDVSGDFNINIDDCSKNLGLDRRIMEVCSTVLSKGSFQCFYKTTGTFKEFDIERILASNVAQESTSSKRRSFSFSRGRPSSFSLSMKRKSKTPIRDSSDPRTLAQDAIQNLNISSPKISKLFQDTLEECLQEFIITQRKEMHSFETDALLPCSKSVATSKNRKCKFFCCFGC